ncbi:4'-phosphopantetheinyl transferase family protein [delta proteobacterium NaphS2]|nr:4'-phosphopantetheinyl transferase family protein [delta proteobacterium NaphS2]
MTRDATDRIKDLFNAGSRDVTPASARHEACVLYAPVFPDAEVSLYCASVLSDAERRRAERFASEHDKARFKQRRAFRRFCGAAALGSSRPLSRILFEETKSGRPYLRDSPDFWFSFSSFRFGLLGAWSSTHGIGVDLEDHTRNLEAPELAHWYFSGAEANAVEGAGGLEGLRTFFRFWTLKEAALKSIGEGLPFGLNAFEFAFDPHLRVVHAPPDYGGPQQFDAYLIEGIDGCCASLVVRDLT